MPMQKGVWREEWDTCDRCGFIHPISMLTKQLGMKLCSDHGCLDDLSNYYRARTIAEKLRQPEGLSDKPQVFKEPGEIRF